MPATFEAIDPGGVVVGTAAMVGTHQAEVVVLASTQPFIAIRARSLSSEVLLQRLCLV